MSEAPVTIVEGNSAESMRKFLRALLERKVVSGVFAPCNLQHGVGVVYALVSDVQGISRVNPFAPVMPVNAAGVISEMTRLAPSGEKLAVLLRPCESRALVELVKLKQAHMENLLIIGSDCLGALKLSSLPDKALDTDRIAAFMKESRADAVRDGLRAACAICEHFVPHTGDINVGLFGVDPEKQLLLIPTSEAGAAALAAAGVGSPGEVPPARQKEIEDRRAKRKEARKAYFAKANEEAGGFAKLLKFFSKCIGCHNCRDACPICYCKECFFDSPVFEFEPHKYVDWAKRKGALRLPDDTILFHLTRLNHMVSSCVSCGACAEACPNGIELAKIFPRVADDVQAIFNYIAGKDPREELPLATFKENELSPLGEG
ncbi:MAG: 4Fe-4S dicluster domain-containing protein [Planctomycetota bacterium]|nr:4Fe-4S dicluster domain-containing protein [Planctomycetota bacterium]